MKPEPAEETRYRGLLLLGPTGSGKTPLGQTLQRRGLWQSRCLHFDFGEQLREVVRRDCPDGLIRREEIDFLGEVLRSGALLEDEHFPIAQHLLQSFLAARDADARTLVVLNGLPRHVGQARAVDAIVEVTAVVYLQCSAETVLARIRANAGGDRADRVDDDLASVRRKLSIFAERTAPLVEHYRAGGAVVRPSKFRPACRPTRPTRRCSLTDRRRRPRRQDGAPQ